MFPSFHIFGWEVGTYGIMVVLGAVACTFVGNNLIKRFGRDIYDFLLILLSIGAGIFIGAHIVYGITHLDLIIKAFQNIGELWFDKFRDVMIYAIGGMVFYGGFLSLLQIRQENQGAEPARHLRRAHSPVSRFRQNRLLSRRLLLRN